MKIKIVTKLEELPQFSPDSPLFSDIESQGLYVGTRLVQMYQPDIDDAIYLFDCAPVGYRASEYIQNLEQIKAFVKPLHGVWYNCAYDLGCLNLVQNNLDDLFFAVKTAYPEFQEFSLDVVITKLFGDLYTGLDKKSLQKAGFKLGAYLSQAQYRYAATDVLALSLMWKDTKIQKVIQNNLAYKVDIISQKYAVKYQQNGLLVDNINREKLLKEAIVEIANLRLLLPAGLNPNSPKQVKEYLGTDSSNHETLVRYALSDNPKAADAKTIIDLRRAIKEKGYLESIAHTYMYTKFNVAGAATGRFTSSGGDLENGFNAQQIPRQFQKLFKADTDTTTVIGLDYATLELRLACAIFGEDEMYKQLLAGEDIHTSMAQMITGKPLHPDGLQGDKNAKSGMADVVYDYVTHKDRTDAKAVNFGYVFGMSAATYMNYAFVSYGIKVTLDEAKLLRERYFTKYPNFGAYHKSIWNNYSKPSFVYTTALGRRVKPRLGTDAINGPVQGSGAETTKLAAHWLIRYDCERLGLDYRTEWEQCEVVKYLFNVVHDAIYLRVPKDTKDFWNEQLKVAMVRGWNEISKAPLLKYKDIPMPVDE